MGRGHYFLPLLPYVLALTFVACAGKPSAPSKQAPPGSAASPPPSPAKAPQPSSPPAVEREEPDPLAELPEESPLKVSVSRWIAEHSDADFDEAARIANRFLRVHGYPLVLDASRLLKKNGTELRLRAGQKTFVFHAGKELSRSADLCGERYLKIPARPLGSDRAAIISQRKEYPFSLKGFGREKFRVFRGERLVATLHAPEPTEPIGLASNGKALYLRFALDEELTAEWWHRMANQHPSLLDEDPYLVLRVEKNRLYFDENLEHLPPQEFEVESSSGKDGDSFRWRFLPSQLVLELQSNCGKP